MRENNFGTNRGIEEITEVQEMKIPQYHKNIPVHRNERCNERRYFLGRNNVCNINGTTYIGRNASHHCLGGSKPSQGGRLRYSKPIYQQRQ